MISWLVSLPELGNLLMSLPHTANSWLCAAHGEHLTVRTGHGEASLAVAFCHYPNWHVTSIWVTWPPELTKCPVAR